MMIDADAEQGSDSFSDMPDTSEAHLMLMMIYGFLVHVDVDGDRI